MRGVGNSIYIQDNTSFTDCVVSTKYDSSNNHIEIGKRVRATKLEFWIEDNNNSITIDEGSSFGINTQLAACEGTSISIGKDCMFSHSILVRTTDSHSILCDNQRINKAESIIIGNHVWIGLQCLIMKGSVIADGCILGARSIASHSKTEPNSINVGSPLKCVKNGITWSRNKV